MTIENKEMEIRFEVDNQQDFDKWYAIRKKQIRADVIDEISNEIDRLNSQGGGIDDLKILLEQLKEQK